MTDIGADYKDCHIAGTVIHVARKSGDAAEYLGHITICDNVKNGTLEALELLKESGVKNTVMLTGDSESVASKIAEELKIGDYRSSLLPEDKVTQIERILTDNTDGTVVFVGDGINDAPVLARADIGVAMGALGSDAAIEAADIVIMDDDLRRLPLAVRIARKTVRIVRENIGFSLAVKIAVLVLSFIVLCPMWIAVFADVGVMMIAILNSLRAMRLNWF